MAIFIFDRRDPHGLSRLSVSAAWLLIGSGMPMGIASRDEIPHAPFNGARGFFQRSSKRDAPGVRGSSRFIETRAKRT